MKDNKINNVYAMVTLIRIIFHLLIIQPKGLWLLEHSGTRKRASQGQQKNKNKKTYNTRDSLVVTHPTTSLALICLSMGERTGSRVLKWVWSYVVFCCGGRGFMVGGRGCLVFLDRGWRNRPWILPDLASLSLLVELIKAR